jgi:type IV pilus assembly protein PilQ
MGDDVRIQRKWWPALAAATAIVAVAWITGCSAAPPPNDSAAAMSAQPVTAPAAEAAAEKPRPVELTAVHLAPLGADTGVKVLATGPLNWTTFNEDGSVVVELRDTVPAPDLKEVHPDAGAVRAVTYEVDQSGESPITRLRVATRGDVNTSVEEGTDALLVRLSSGSTEPLPASAEVAESAPQPKPAAAPSQTIVAEDLAKPEPPAVEPTPVGTADAPYVAPAPSGVQATQLRNIEVSKDSAGTHVLLVGDGAFRYSTFQLDDPSRFVLDLAGVVDAVPQSAIDVGDGRVDRIRMAQFRSQPERVARVVFDLSDRVLPKIESTGDGLRLLFPTGMSTGEAAEQMVAQEESSSTETEAEPQPAAAPQMTATAPAMTVSEEASTASAKAEQSGALTAGMESASPKMKPAMDEQPTVQEEAAAAPIQMAPASATPPAAQTAQNSSEVALFESAQVQSEATDVGSPTPAEQAASNFQGQTVAGGSRQYRGEPISLSLVDADIKDTLRSFAQISGLNIVVYPGVKGSVTVELKNVPWDQALEEILRMNNLSFQIEGNIMRIAPRAQFQREAQAEQRLKAAQALSVPLRTVIKRISYASAQNISSVLKGGGGGSVMSQRGSVIVDQRTNTLIIRELPRYMDTVLAVIEHLDTPEPQVRIEARIVETTKRFNRSLGIDWSFDAIADAAHGNTTGLMFPNNANAQGGVNLLTGGNNAFLGLSMGNVLNTFTLDASLQAAESEGLINILSTPSVTVLNNGSASIQSGLQIPIQTVANNTVSVQFVNATLRLRVTPHITAEGTVLMDINVQKRTPQLAFAVVGATNAPIDTKQARTRVIVRDGGTTVIGGIYEVSTDQGSDRVPGLANIPVIGHLFKNHRRTDENKELLIFITPRVIKL